MVEASQRAGVVRNQLTILVDMRGLGLRHLSPSVISVLQKRTKLEESHYPEVCRRYVSAEWGAVLPRHEPLPSQLWLSGCRRQWCRRHLTVRVTPPRLRTVCRALIMNAPRIFPSIFNMFRPFLAEETRKKVWVLASASDLTKFVALDTVPAFMGGACRCEGDADCRSRYESMRTRRLLTCFVAVMRRRVLG